MNRDMHDWKRSAPSRKQRMRGDDAGTAEGNHHSRSANLCTQVHLKGAALEGSKIFCRTLNVSYSAGTMICMYVCLLLT